MAEVAFLIADQFEDTEFKVPFDRLRQAGHGITLLGARKDVDVRGKRGQITLTVTSSVNEVRPDRFDALVIPGGYSPDHLRMDGDVVRFVRAYGALGRPIAAICHGPSLLVDAELLDGRRVTSWPSIRKDLENAGARWEDRDVIEDGNLITSRNPKDAEAFVTAILNRIRVAVPA